MTSEFEWFGILVACGLLGLMFLVPTVVLIADARKANRQAELAKLSEPPGSSGPRPKRDDVPSGDQEQRFGDVRG